MIILKTLYEKLIMEDNSFTLTICISGLKPVPITRTIDQDKIFESRNFSGALDDPEDIAKAFGNIDKFNDKYRVSQYVIDQDLAARIMMEKGVSVGVNGPSLESLAKSLRQDVKEATTLKTVLKASEDEIRNKPYENCYAFGPDGRIILSRSYSVNTIVITREEGERLKGAIFTHNHTHSSSFSPADISTSCGVGLKEIKVASSKYSYSMKLKDGFNFSETLWSEEIQPAMNRHYYDVKFEFTAKIATGEISLEDAELQHWHEVWSRVVKEIDKLEYIRT